MFYRQTALGIEELVATNPLRRIREIMAQFHSPIAKINIGETKLPVAITHVMKASGERASSTQDSQRRRTRQENCCIPVEYAFHLLIWSPNTLPTSSPV